MHLVLCMGHEKMTIFFILLVHVSTMNFFPFVNHLNSIYNFIKNLTPKHLSKGNQRIVKCRNEIRFIFNPLLQRTKKCRATASQWRDYESVDEKSLSYAISLKNYKINYSGSKGLKKIIYIYKKI